MSAGAPRLRIRIAWCAEPPEVLDDDLVFVACSGDNAIDIYGGTRFSMARRSMATTRSSKHSRAPRPCAALRIAQHRRERCPLRRHCASVVAPGECSDLGPAWHRNLTRLPDIIRPAYQAVQRAFPDTPVLVVPYPIPLAKDKGKCGYTTFTKDEHAFLYDFALRLDKVIEKVVAEPRSPGRSATSTRSPKPSTAPAFATHLQATSA